MKKLIAMVAVLCVACGMSACGNKSGVRQNDGGGQNAPKYSDTKMQSVQTTYESAVKLRDEIEKNKDKLTAEQKEDFADEKEELAEAEAEIKKGLEALHEDDLDELKSDIDEINNELLEISMAIDGDTTTEYKEYSKKEPNGELMNEIIDECEDASEKRRELVGKITDDNADKKAEFDKLTEQLYNVQQKIHNDMEKMSKEELISFKSEVEALDDAFDKLD